MSKEMSLKKRYSMIVGVMCLLGGLYEVYQIIASLINFQTEYLTNPVTYVTFIQTLIWLILGVTFIMDKETIVTPIVLGINLVIAEFYFLGTIATPFLYKSMDMPVILGCLQILSRALAIISAAIILSISLVSHVKKESAILKWWFVPAILHCFVNLIQVADNFGWGYPFGYIVFTFLIAVITDCVYYSLLALCFCNYTPILEEENSDSDGYCDMLKHILLLIFVNIIWIYIWVYRVTKYLNITPNVQKRNPITKLFLYLFVPFYNVYWNYQSAKSVDILAQERNLRGSIKNACLVLSFLIPILPPMIIQSKINEICKISKDGKDENGELRPIDETDNNIEFIRDYTIV